MKIKQLSIALITVCGWLTLSAANAQHADSLRLDLNTALEIALSENPKIKVADMEITKKEYAKKPEYCDCGNNSFEEIFSQETRETTEPMALAVLDWIWALPRLALLPE